MANHTFQCPHCGDDQRLTFPCCATVLASERAAAGAHLAREEERRALFERHGITCRQGDFIYRGDRIERWSWVPDADSLFAFLSRLATS